MTEKTLSDVVPPTTLVPTTIPDDLIRDAGRGTENIGPEDVRPPRILICQAGSPQRKPDDSRQIIGLNELDIFNDLSGEIYGRGPLRFAVINALPARYIEFEPGEGANRKVLDFDVPPGDPRTQFTTDAEGKRQKPAASKFYDFLVWLTDHSELAILSFKSTQLKVAVQLNGKMKLPLKGELIHPSLKGQVQLNPPAWARTFSVTTFMDKRDNLSWGNYNLKFEGLTPVKAREMCSQLASVYARKNVVVEHDEVADSADENVPF